MLTLHTTRQFRKDEKLAWKGSLDIFLLKSVIQTLLKEKPLDPKHKDHSLTKPHRSTLIRNSPTVNRQRNPIQKCRLVRCKENRGIRHVGLGGKPSQRHFPKALLPAFRVF